MEKSQSRANVQTKIGKYPTFNLKKEQEGLIQASINYSSLVSLVSKKVNSWTEGKQLKYYFLERKPEPVGYFCKKSAS